MSKKGQRFLVTMRNMNAGNQGSKTEKQVADHIQRLREAWNELNDKMGERRKMLNDCSQYLQFSDAVRT